MKPECYSCPGDLKGCADYTPCADSNICIQSKIADEDKKRKETGNFDAIVSKQTLATHLYDTGEDIWKVRQVLPKF
jgi:hypothetical protein